MVEISTIRCTDSGVYNKRPALRCLSDDNFSIVIRLLQSDESGRDGNFPVVFVGNFPSWNYGVWFFYQRKTWEGRIQTPAYFESENFES